MFIKSKRFIPYNSDLKEKARKLRNEMTLAEKKLWYQYLKSNKYKFLRQKTIDNFILDFYCQKLKLAIEVDGETHFTEGEKERDFNRTKKLNEFGIKVIRFWNNEIFDNFEWVIEKIEDEVYKISGE